MKILTWNINGIRPKVGMLKDLFQSLDADIICLQETKVTRDLLDERTAIVEGYNSYYSFSRAKSGYSGVVTFVKNSATPWLAEDGLSGVLRSANEEENLGCYGDQSEFSDEELHLLDKEGRAILTKHKLLDEEGEEKWLTVINVYCPRADADQEDRRAFKMQFYQLLQKRAQCILQNGSHVIILGDVNTSHKRIDHCDPYEGFDERPDRIWMTQLLRDKESLDEGDASSGGGKFVDTFRYFHPDQRSIFTCWSTASGARVTNYGTRIDYILADVKLTKDGFESCSILSDVQGSDHCPVAATLKWGPLSCKKCPPLCTKYMPEFTGKQQKLLSYFTKVSSQPAGPEKKLSEDAASKCASAENNDDPKTGSGDNSNSIKRKNSEPHKTEAGKRVKKQPSGSKQRSLMTFFAKSNSNEAKTEIPEKSQSEIEESNEKPAQEPNEKDAGETTEKRIEPNKTRNEASAKWKMLLKGPTPPPLCPGHKEPCVIRTVVKESLNKGRQFYVCNRPDGHKTNPEARCNHFEWIDKKK